MRKKLGEISSFETVLCMFVVMIHVLSDSVRSYPQGSFLSGLTSIFSRTLTFAVPAFVITSGIKFAHLFSEGDFNYFTFLKRRITKIYIPYLVVASIYYFYFVFHRGYFPFSWAKYGEYMALGTIAAPFYFIIIIMQLYILAPLTLGFCKNITPIFGIIIAGIITILSKYFLLGFRYSDRIFLTYFVYWIMGCYLGINFDMNMEKIRSKKLPIIIGGCFLTVIYSVLAYLEDLAVFNSFSTEILKIFFASFASFMWLIFMPRYEHEGADILSPATFYIYLIHCLVIFETEHIMEKLSITSIPQRFWITFFSTYLISIILSVIYAHVKIRIFKRR